VSPSSILISSNNLSLLPPLSDGKLLGLPELRLGKALLFCTGAGSGYFSIGFLTSSCLAGAGSANALSDCTDYFFFNSNSCSSSFLAASAASYIALDSASAAASSASSASASTCCSSY